MIDVWGKDQYRYTSIHGGEYIWNAIPGCASGKYGKIGVITAPDVVYEYLSIDGDDFVSYLHEKCLPWLLVGKCRSIDGHVGRIKRDCLSRPSFYVVSREGNE